MARSSTTTWENFKLSFKTGLDTALGRLYDYHNPVRKPAAVNGRIWATPTNLPSESPEPWAYFLHYFQTQGLGPTRNECMTTSAVMSMNIMEDRIASTYPEPIRYISNLMLEDYIRELDARGILGWNYRFSTGSPLPGMMTPWQAVIALRRHAAKLKVEYGKSYKVQLKSSRTLDDLVKDLTDGKIILIHGAWRIKLTDPNNSHLAFMGGMPHTMVLVGYDAADDEWIFLNPAEPWITNRKSHIASALYQMKTEKLITDFWGRKFLFYPPRFSITVLTPAP